MGLKLEVEAHFDLNDLTSALQSADEIFCKSQLLSLEQSVRHRLEHPNDGDATWFDDLAKALKEAPGVTALDLRCELLLLVVQWHYSQRRSLEAVPLAKQAYELALKANALALQRRALSNLGMLYIDSKNLSEATICLVRALILADRLGDRVGKCASLANLATARFEAGLLDEAIQLYQYVIVLAGSEVAVQQIVVEAHHNIALSALILDDLSRAREHMECAMKLLIAPATQFLLDQRIVMELTFIKVLVRLGDLYAARRRMNIATEYARRSGSKLADIQSKLASILIDAAEGNPGASLARLKTLEAEVAETEPAYRDVLEIELQCSRLSGQHQYDRYYSRRYLSHLAVWQRKIANQQFAILRKSLLGTGSLSTVELNAFPEEAGHSIGTSAAACDRTAVLLGHLETLAIVAEMREDATGEHSFRAGRLAATLAVSIGYSTNDAADLELAIRLHDIGKLAIPDAILLKRSKLNLSETEIVRRHTVEGCQMLSEMLLEVESTALRAHVAPLRLAAEVALHHHEWWDGTGYPRRLRGETIPESARIAALADVFDELTHARPYRRALSVEKALSKMMELSSKQFDPHLCTEFVTIVRDLGQDPASPMIGSHPPNQASSFTAANRIIQRIARTASLPNIAADEIFPRSV